MAKPTKPVSHSEYDFDDGHSDTIPHIEAIVMVILLLLLSASGLLFIIW